MPWSEGPPPDPILALGQDIPGAIITSGRRTPDGNASLSGSATNSNHLTGDAIDVVPGTSGMTAQQIADDAQQRGYRPLIESDHVHIDHLGNSIPYIGTQGSQGQGPNQLVLGQWSEGPPSGAPSQSPSGQWSEGPPQPAVDPLSGMSRGTPPATPTQPQDPMGLEAFKAVYQGAPEFGPWLQQHLGGEGSFTGDASRKMADYYAHVLQLYPALANAGISDIIDTLGSAAGVDDTTKRRIAGQANEFANVGGMFAGGEAGATAEPVRATAGEAADLDGAPAPPTEAAPVAVDIHESEASASARRALEKTPNWDKLSPEAQDVAIEQHINEPAPEFGHNEVIDLPASKGGPQPVRAMSTDELGQQLAAEDTQKFNPAPPKDAETDRLKSQAEQTWLDAHEKYNTDNGVDESKPIDLNGPATQAADKAVQQFWIDNDRRSVPRDEAPAETPSEPPQEPPQEPPSGGGGDGTPPPPEEPPTGGGPVPPGEDPVAKITKALQDAAPLRKTQDEMMAQARSQRVAAMSDINKTTSGEDRFLQKMGALKGELPKASFESIRSQFSDEDISHLFDMIHDHPALTEFDKINASVGLGKLLNKDVGAIPAPRELSLLSKVFPSDMIKAAVKNRSTGSNIFEGVKSIATLPRTLMSSIDLSAPLRQGVFFSTRKEFYPAFGNMFKYFGSQKAFDGLQDSIESSPTYPLMQEAGLDLTFPARKYGDNGGPALDDVASREEAFSSPLAERIPILGRGVKMSERAYVGFINKLRADSFNTIAKQMAESGISFESNPKALKDLGSFINTATGRGNLGKTLNNAAPLLSSIFYAPRLIASRINLMNPLYYLSLHPAVRAEAVKSLVGFTAAAITVLSLAKMAGAKVEEDPRSSDWAKIRVGDTRFDILGGAQQYIRFGAEMASNQSKAIDGPVKTLGAKYGDPTRLDVAGHFLVNKAAPIPSALADWMRGMKDSAGQPVTPTSMVGSRFIPLFLQDYNDAVKQYGIKEGSLVAVPGLFGVGLQTFQPNQKPDVYGGVSHDDPTVQALSSMTSPAGNPVVSSPSHSFKDDNDKTVKLTDDQYKDYVSSSGKAIVAASKQRMSQPDWKALSDEDKHQEIKDIQHDAREDWRDKTLGRNQPQWSEGPVQNNQLPQGWQVNQ